MTKTQFWILNTLAIVLSILIVANIGISIANRSLGSKIQKAEVQLSNFPNLQTAARNIITKVAQYAKDDDQLQALLAKYNLKVSYDNKANNGAAAPAAGR